MVFNPTQDHQTTNLTLPLYYTGLDLVAKIQEQEGDPHTYQLERDYSVDVHVNLHPYAITWFLIR